jgi:hypothetical protein
LLDHPQAVLTQLCERLDIPWDPAMLSWESGPKPEDGIWGAHWYTRLHQTTGFEPYAPKTDPFPAELEPLYEECAPLYERLKEYAIEE